MELHDFSKAEELVPEYTGSEKKKTMIYNHKKYLVKFPDPTREKKRNNSYINNVFSEYIGSHVFEMAGIETQKTLLGTYLYKGQEKIVCACEDFTNDHVVLYEFEKLALSTKLDKKVETELLDIMEVIEESRILDSDLLKEKFWDMFVIDALIGNNDRHNANWGFLVDLDKNTVGFAPIYDCGSCLNPVLEDEDLKALNDVEIKNLAINYHCCITENDNKISPLLYISGLKNDDCNKALKRVFNRINIFSINEFIDSISCISQIRKDFYKKIINIRYDLLKESFVKLS